MSAVASPTRRPCSQSRRRTWRGILLVLGVLAMVYLSLELVDVPLARAVSQLPQDGFLGGVSCVGMLLGGWYTAPILLAAALVVAGNRWRELLSTVVIAYLIRSAPVEWLKFLAGRPRPRQLEHLATTFTGPSLHYHSFPSGHASFVFMFAIILGAYFPRWRWLAYTYAVFVSLTRVLCNAHFLSDVMLGGLIGALSGFLVLYWWPPAPRKAQQEQSTRREAVLARGDTGPAATSSER